MPHQVQYLDPYSLVHLDKSVETLYRTHPQLKQEDLARRIDSISAAFLGRPYLLGANGEGPEGRFDQAPVYRFDGFDCVTYVNTVLALAKSHDSISFRKNLINIAYRDNQLDYLHRNHFMSTDWNAWNQKNGLIEDITESLSALQKKPIHAYADTLIDKPNWLRFRTYKDIRLLESLPINELVDRLKELHALADQVGVQATHLPYLKLSELFNEKGQPRQDRFDLIPHGAIIELVRPNWDMRDKIGTNLNVSHVGFAIWKGNQLYYRQASSIEKRVIDILLTDYLQYRLYSPSVKGINIQLAG